MADTQTIPTPVDAPATKPGAARSAAMDLIDDAAHLDGAAPRELSPGDADELIARMADAQIDQLLADDDAGKSPALARPTPVATTPIEAVVPPESTSPGGEPVEDPLAAIDAMLAADEAPPLAPRPAPVAAPPVVSTTPIEAVAPIEDPLTGDPLSAIDAMLAADEAPPLPKPEFPASFSPPQSKRPQVAEAPPAVDVPPVEVPPAAPFAAAEPIALPPAEPVHELQSSAEAVAAELAADARLAPPRPSATPAEGSPDAVVDDEPHGLRAVPVAALELINYPVRGLSDGAREILGAIAVVTLANATALLLYLAIFRG